MKTKTLPAVLCFLLLLAPLVDAAQYLEVTTEIEVTRKPGAPPGQRHTIVSRCIFGTNTWLIQGNFVGNGQKTWWCTGSNIIEQTIWTNTGPAKPKDFSARVAVISSPAPPSLPLPGLVSSDAVENAGLPLVMTNLWR